MHEKWYAERLDLQEELEQHREDLAYFGGKARTAYVAAAEAYTDKDYATGDVEREAAGNYMAVHEDTQYKADVAEAYIMDIDFDRRKLYQGSGHKAEQISYASQMALIGAAAIAAMFHDRGRRSALLAFDSGSYYPEISNLNLQLDYTWNELRGIQPASYKEHTFSKKLPLPTEIQHNVIQHGSSLGAPDLTANWPIAKAGASPTRRLFGFGTKPQS